MTRVFPPSLNVHLFALLQHVCLYVCMYVCAREVGSDINNPCPLGAPSWKSPRPATDKAHPRARCQGVSFPFQLSRITSNTERGRKGGREGERRRRERRKRERESEGGSEGRVFTDISGKFRRKSKQGNNYFTVFVCAKSPRHAILGVSGGQGPAEMPGAG